MTKDKRTPDGSFRSSERVLNSSDFFKKDAAFSGFAVSDHQKGTTKSRPCLQNGEFVIVSYTDNTTCDRDHRRSL